MKLGLILGAALMVAHASSAPVAAEPLGADDCMWVCQDCRHTARTHEADRQCTALAAGCCIAYGQKPPSMGCSCGGPVTHQ
jgi:hypothetical protein